MVKGCSGIYSYDILPISESRLRKAVKEGMGIHQYTHPRFRCPAWLASYTWRFTYYIYGFKEHIHRCAGVHI